MKFVLSSQTDSSTLLDYRLSLYIIIGISFRHLSFKRLPMTAAFSSSDLKISEIYGNIIIFEDGLPTIIYTLILTLGFDGMILSYLIA